MSSVMALPDDLLRRIIMCCSILDLLRVLATNRKLQAISAELLTTAKDAVKAFNTAISFMPAYRLCQLASLMKLDLCPISEYGIGIVGMQALAGVVSSGALAQLTRLDLDGNSIGDTGMSALASACASRALHKLKELHLYSNQIGDAGLSSLADAVSSGALDHLTVCWRLAALFQCLETWHVHSPYA